MLYDFHTLHIWKAKNPLLFHLLGVALQRI